MSLCDSCKDWYHGSCIGITEKMAREIPSYDCEECAEVRKENEVLLEERRRQQAEAARIRREKADAEARLKASRPDPITVATTAPSKTAEAVSPATFWVHGKQVIQPPTVAPASSSKRHASLVNPLERKASVTSVTSLPSRPAMRHQPQDLENLMLGPILRRGSATRSDQLSGRLLPTLFRRYLWIQSCSRRCWRRMSIKLNPASFAAQVEDELFDFLSDGIRGHRRSCGEKDLARIAIGALSADVLVRLEAEDLANEEIKAKSEAIRLEGIRNAIKPKDVAPALFKKTHKGEVEISMSDPAVAPIKDTSASNAEADRIYGVPATRGLARLVEKLRSPSPVGEQKPFHSLDDLLAKMGGTTTVKRSPDHNDKSRVQEDAPYDVDMHVDHDYSNPVVRSPVDFTSTWEEAADEGFADDTITPIYSPSRSPLVDLDMPPPPPQAATSGTGSSGWPVYPPPTVTIEGRIDTRRAKDYVGLQRQSPSKEIVAVEFRPDETSEDAEKNREGFKALFDYFYDKNRYAVVGQNYISVKDMYLVPIKAGESVPEMITVLKNCNVDVGQRSYDCIFGVVILDKNFFVKTSMKAERSSAKRSSKSAHESRKKHAPEPAMKPPAPVAPMIPPSPPYPSLPRFLHTPIVNAPARPQTSSPLLAQLQHQQQPVQQQPCWNILAQLQNANPALLGFGQR
ncbi:hypothetical protein BC829DRAFT_385029 [Chytridium lagenaria]|nr:hypothetical protein BC829DRAFT_385029 [Chytridium lagenaria]